MMLVLPVLDTDADTDTDTATPVQNILAVRPLKTFF